MTGNALGLFQGFGIEVEYMIVKKDDLSVFPSSDQILRHFSGAFESEIERGPLNWSNELVLHVIELKTAGPVPSLDPLPALFHRDVGQINAYLETIGGRLMPSAMHPWMDPSKETRLWPHEYNEVYESYNRIFGCRGHGWSNLQSQHLNLAFDGDDEFGRLHAAIRLILPILPALAASSPVVDGRPTGIKDNRLEFYRNNQRKIPSLTGAVIPEPVYTRKDYQTKILNRLYADIAPHDSSRILQNEWINSRGAIARFDRNAIEIRLIDVQESPLADLAVASAVTAVLRLLISEKLSAFAAQSRFSVEPLAVILDSCIRDAEDAVIDNGEYLRVLGLHGRKSLTAGWLWNHLIDRASAEFQSGSTMNSLDVILKRGSLSTRILKALGGSVSRDAMSEVYGEMADCLAEGRLFAP